MRLCVLPTSANFVDYDIFSQINAYERKDVYWGRKCLTVAIL